MRVFITGGAGFIGSHLADALIARGDHVTILDNLSTGSAANIAHIKDQLEIHQGDIRDQALVESLVEKSDLVLHMAAALGVSTILEKTVESVRAWQIHQFPDTGRWVDDTFMGNTRYVPIADTAVNTRWPSDLGWTIYSRKKTDLSQSVYQAY
jgi:NAD(P)-dependent dehydrogenase (short-subunit alcohol dehydrogenase family)